MLFGYLMRPNRPGWYWFLPDKACPTPTGLLRLDKPVVLLVGQELYNLEGPVKRLVVRFGLGPTNMLYVDDMSGDWEVCKEPKRMRREALRRAKADQE